MRRILIVAAFCLLTGSCWLALTYGQVDKPALNIVYFHVPGAICALLCFVGVLIGSVGFLAAKNWAYDHFAAASAEMGLVCATVLNLTGVIWSRAEWNIWWTASPRLVSSAILWFLYAAYLILRAGIPSAGRRGQFCAVFGIIAFVDVPLVYISARLIPDVHRPWVGFESGLQWLAFGAAVGATALMAGLVIWIRYDILEGQKQLEQSIYS